MDTTVHAIEEKAKAGAAHSAPERRRRRRAKISAQVYVRATNGTDSFEEVCSSIDVSRDGLLFTAGRAGYWKGQQLHIVFPYSNSPSALNTAQVADIVRVSEQPGGKFAVAVHFHAAKTEIKTERKSAGSASSSTSALTDGDSLAAASVSQKQTSMVLAVEPDVRTAETMRNMLQQDGYNVVIVSTAQEALDILRTTVPAVFIAEVEATDMSGHDLCLIIKRNERLQRVPVILLTRSAQPADYSASHQMGAVVCMAKPFQPERLQHVVRLVAPPPTLGAKTVYGSRASNSINNAVERTL